MQAESHLHIGIIMDGNGRWATARGLPRVAGHREGAKAVRRVIESAPGLGIGTLTLYAFSSDNWQRPRPEVNALMRLFRQYLRGEIRECQVNGVRISVIGRRDRLPSAVLEAIDECETATAAGRTLLVRLAVDYSSRDAIVQAAQRAAYESAAAVRSGVPVEDLSRAQFARYMADAIYADSAPDLDLVIRTGGEQRVSDFFLWEAAYAELYFTRTMWPDFGEEHLAAAVSEFHRRERRFGAVPEAAITAAPAEIPLPVA
jgi:undecaprenyl diphosphate synthase